MEKKIEMMRHSCAHLVAAAVKELYGDVKFGVGPVIDNGFYYDIDFGEKSINDEDLKKIEKKAKELQKQSVTFERQEMSIDEAIKFFKSEGQDYKVELLKDLKEKGTTKINSEKELVDAVGNDVKNVSLYKTLNFTDLCRGPHVEKAKEVGYFQLTRLAGVYWRGDEKNPQLTRIYGVCFETKEKLKEYFEFLKEAEKRDHRKLGKELDLFCFSDLVGPGLPLYTPKGTVIIEELKKHIESVCKKYDYEKVSTPSLAKLELFEISGHAKKFGDELFHVTSKKQHDLVLKPVQCPHHTQIYASKIRSYKDLPIRYMESDKQYRAEKTGEISGLSRVYAITIEDGHSFCRVDQVKDEIKNLVNMIKDFYSAIGLWGNHWISLSLRDYVHPEKYIGTKEDWDECERILEEVCEEMDLGAKRCEGEAALYGPKIDFIFKTVTGQEIQIPTVQIDFATPKRFGLVYTDKNGEEVNPVMVHRAVLGSYERFLVMLIEHFAGNFPVWLSPVQVKFVPVSEKHIEFTAKLVEEFKDKNIRVEVDNADETVGKKIKKAIAQKPPYIIVVGDNEIAGDDWTVRVRGEEKQLKISKDKFLEKIKKEIEERK